MMGLSSGLPVGQRQLATVGRVHLEPVVLGQGLVDPAGLARAVVVVGPGRHDRLTSATRLRFIRPKL